MLLWVDAGFDGIADIDSGSVDEAWRASVKRYTSFDAMAKAITSGAPQKATVRGFVSSMLDACQASEAAWISVPQLPIDGGTRGRPINRALAEAAGEWRARSSFSGKLILPLIVSSSKLISSKTARNPLVALAKQCREKSQADGLWTVDAGLSDEHGSAKLLEGKVAAVLALHEELSENMDVPIRVGGPYWGTNLLLWAKGLIDYSAIGIGSGYQYLRSGGRSMSPSARIAIPSLKRRVLCDPALWAWMDQAMAVLGPDHPVSRELAGLQRRSTSLSEPEHAKQQVVSFYREWTQRLAALPAAGRPMGLFQDLSAAYAIGRSLPDLPEGGPNRRPESIAKPLMLNCL
ncbi:MAG: hypothetical protein IT349_21230 [Candidatus Eisenbacteria bacterium]|nr:hypothetical protein [Candidatus Eisenbacteria bacterium]